MLHLHRAERTDAFVDALAAVLEVRPTDPLAQEVVAVPARGIERWLTQQLSHRLGAAGTGAGACANIRFVSPGALVDEALAAVGTDEAARATGARGRADRDDPWRPEALRWQVLRALGRTTDSTALEVALGRPLIAAQHLAELFSGYGSQRPELLRKWVDGCSPDGDLAWQAGLWRDVRGEIGRPSPGEQLPELCAAIRRCPERIGLPERLSVFGPTRLSRSQLAVLAALAEARDVHLWLPHPSPALWEAIGAAGMDEGPVCRRGDPTVSVARHPLLASLGRDARELQLLLADVPAPTQHHHHPLPPRPDTLLGRLQGDLAADRPPVPAPLDGQDRSLQIHACHGPARQVEVLREVLLGLLERDPTLEPRDVLVMCPDIEAYAPLISATFGLSEEGEADHPGHRLRVKLADRSLRQTNPLLATIAALLELADGRVTASQVLDLAASPPVRRRFRLDDEDLELLRDWAARTGIRWGLDADDRAPFKLQQVPQNTWQSGLDRLLLGAAMSEDEIRWLGPALPLDDVDSADVDVAGRLAELLDRLGQVLAELRGPQTLTAWLTGLTTALERLTDVSGRDAWQPAQVRRELADVAISAGEEADRIVLRLDDVRALLADRLKGRPTRANFRTGSLTMCSMVPMRSVPHRVICLLGLDDGAYPRNAILDGDDLLARDPLVGERDPRSEDRQLLLDAILAAEEHLVILYSGADERTNARRAPAVPVGEILDVVDAMAEPEPAAEAAGKDRGRQRVVVEHPLQPFDRRNFTDGALGTSGPFSFDRPALAGARSAEGARRPAPPLLSAPLAAQPNDPVELDALVRFLEHPVRAFFRQRLELTVARDEDEVADELTVELEPLDQWAVGERMLQARLAGADAATVGQAEYRRGSLPPGKLGSRLFQDLLADLEPLLQVSADLRRPERRTVDVAVDLPDGRRLSGTVGGVHDSTLVRVVYSRLGTRHRLRAWAQLLALSAGHPEQTWRAVTIGRRGSDRGARRSTLGPLDAEQARTVLAELVDLHDRGLREPLPLTVKTSFRYAGLRSRNRPPEVALQQAAKDWTGNFGEQHDREHELAWGSQPSLDQLVSAPPGDDERWFDEPSRFGALARRVWTPLLAAEVIEE